MNYPQFEQAQKRLHAILAKYRWPTHFGWINAEESIYLGGLFYVIDSERINDPDRIKIQYQAAMKQLHGIMFSAICASDTTSYCHLYIPKSTNDAKSKSISKQNLKLFMPTIKTPCRILKNEIQANLLKQTEKKFLQWKTEKFE